MFCETKIGFCRSYFEAQIIRSLVGIMVVVILAVGVTLPIVSTLTASANITGIPAIIISYLSMIIAVYLLLVVAGIFG